MTHRLFRSANKIAIGIAISALALIPLQASPQQVEDAVAPASVTFTLDFPASSPPHYSVAVNAAGNASYECVAKIAEDSPEETYRMEFKISEENRKRIFEWTKQARYFSGKVDSGNPKLAFTGAKMLSYREGKISNVARYNFSNLEAVRELTTLFQNMAGTLEYAHRLAYYHRYQKLALDEELKRMEMQARNNELSEIQGVADVLREISDDPSVINVVRTRAKQLMQMAAR